MVVTEGVGVVEYPKEVACVGESVGKLISNDVVGKRVGKGTPVMEILEKLMTP